MMSWVLTGKLSEWPQLSAGTKIIHTRAVVVTSLKVISSCSYSFHRACEGRQEKQ